MTEGYEPEAFKALLAKHGYEEPRCHSYVDKGWWAILDELFARLKLAGVTELAQVKEKFGGLRVYIESRVDSPDDDGPEPLARRLVVRQAIDEAETKCWRTCETCGAEGKKRGGWGWMKVRCDKCEQEYSDFRRKEMGEGAWLKFVKKREEDAEAWRKARAEFAAQQDAEAKKGDGDAS